MPRGGHAGIREPAGNTVAEEARTSLPAMIAVREDDRRLKLQAIAWSAIPEKRIAVINDRVLREGSVVDGILVLRIDDSRVVVRENGLTWEIPLILQ